MHPVILILLAAVVIAAVLGLASMARGPAGEPDEARMRRLLVTGLAILLAINVAMAGFGWFTVVNSDETDTSSTLANQEDLLDRLAVLELRLQALESTVSSGDSAPAQGDRIVDALDSVIVRRSPGGDVLTRLSGGTGIDVSYCMSRREAGQYWCEIRTPEGDTGWVPRTLIEPPPALSGARGG